MARKWRERVAVGRKRVHHQVDGSNASTVSKKGYFVFYTADEGRFKVPLGYLNHPIFLELFKKSEEEFGLSSDGPITLPCDAVFMDYVLLLIQNGAAKDFEKVLLNSITIRRCSISASQQGYAVQNLLVSVC
ncbi:auxin-responsive protein SAUR61-like [Juglans microcarpa x Juglans regia]|uniref:auxin-responsive protein SAUR61-like n=1 Tax=Juglans microcarpa x Juglans regia TaxID=2249226 RepID=UPI001B7F2696|nr:auxin-responsive protein SAUR61-like [Juglans microcarpa x Juglans regia]